MGGPMDSLPGACVPEWPRAGGCGHGWRRGPWSPIRRARWPRCCPSSPRQVCGQPCSLERVPARSTLRCPRSTPMRFRRWPPTVRWAPGSASEPATCSARLTGRCPASPRAMRSVPTAGSSRVDKSARHRTAARDREAALPTWGGWPPTWPPGMSIRWAPPPPTARTMGPAGAPGYSCTPLGRMPATPADRAIDYVGTPLRAQHVLASAAIPVVFPPARVKAPRVRPRLVHRRWRAPQHSDRNRRWHWKSPGLSSSPATPAPTRRRRSPSRPTRLRRTSRTPRRSYYTPYSPTRWSMTYAGWASETSCSMAPPRRRSRRPPRAPPIPLRALLAVHTGQRPNSPSLPRRCIRRCGPGGGTKTWWSYQIIGRLLAGGGFGEGNHELLSYLLFNADYARAQIDRGQTHALTAWNRGWQVGPP